jgi:hypothetical protein
MSAIIIPDDTIPSESKRVKSSRWLTERQRLSALDVSSITAIGEVDDKYLVVSYKRDLLYYDRFSWEYKFRIALSKARILRSNRIERIQSSQCECTLETTLGNIYRSCTSQRTIKLERERAPGSIDFVDWYERYNVVDARTVGGTGVIVSRQMETYSGPTSVVNVDVEYNDVLGIFARQGGIVYLIARNAIIRLNARTQKMSVDDTIRFDAFNTIKKILVIGANMECCLMTQGDYTDRILKVRFCENRIRYQWIFVDCIPLFMSSHDDAVMYDPVQKWYRRCLIDHIDDITYRFTVPAMRYEDPFVDSARRRLYHGSQPLDKYIDSSSIDSNGFIHIDERSSDGSVYPRIDKNTDWLKAINTEGTIGVIQHISGARRTLRCVNRDGTTVGTSIILSNYKTRPQVITVPDQNEICLFECNGVLSRYTIHCDGFHLKSTTLSARASYVISICRAILVLGGRHVIGYNSQTLYVYDTQKRKPVHVSSLKSRVTHIFADRYGLIYIEQSLSKLRHVMTITTLCAGKLVQLKQYETRRRSLSMNNKFAYDDETRMLYGMYHGAKIIYGSRLAEYHKWSSTTHRNLIKEVKDMIETIAMLWSVDETIINHLHKGILPLLFTAIGFLFVETVYQLPQPEDEPATQRTEATESLVE